MKIISEDVQYDIDETRSFKDLTNQYHGLIPEGTVVYSSSMYSETPGFHAFDTNTHGVTFVKCNLDNVVIPDGNTLINCSTKRFKSQPDGFDWLVDAQNNPTEKM